MVNTDEQITLAKSPPTSSSTCPLAYKRILNFSCLMFHWSSAQYFSSVAIVFTTIAIMLNKVFLACLTCLVQFSSTLPDFMLYFEIFYGLYQEFFPKHSWERHQNLIGKNKIKNFMSLLIWFYRFNDIENVIKSKT